MSCLDTMIATKMPPLAVVNQLRFQQDIKFAGLMCSTNIRQSDQFQLAETTGHDLEQG